MAVGADVYCKLSEYVHTARLQGSIFNNNLSNYNQLEMNGTDVKINQTADFRWLCDYSFEHSRNTSFCKIHTTCIIDACILSKFYGFPGNVNSVSKWKQVFLQPHIRTKWASLPAKRSSQWKAFKIRQTKFKFKKLDRGVWSLLATSQRGIILHQKFTVPIANPWTKISSSYVWRNGRQCGPGLLNAPKALIQPPPPRGRYAHITVSNALNRVFTGYTTNQICSTA